MDWLFNLFGAWFWFGDNRTKTANAADKHVLPISLSLAVGCFVAIIVFAVRR